VETTGTGFVIIDGSGCVLDANDEYVRLTGRADREEVLGHNLAEWSAPENRERNDAAIRRCLETGALRGYDDLYLGRSDSAIPIEVNATAVEVGGQARILALCLDVSERKRQEHVVRESERRLRDVLENVDLLAVVLDRDGRVTFCNARTAALLNSTPAALLGQDWLELTVAEPERTALREGIRRQLIEGVYPKHYERLIQTTAGACSQVMWDATLLHDRHGQVEGVAALGRDVTELRRLEEQLREAQKLEAVGQLAGGVAHDFNNLLQVVIGYLSLVSEQLKPGQWPRREVEQALTASSHAASLVKQLLAFSRRQMMRPAPVSLSEVVESMSELLQRVCGEHIELRTEFAPDTPPVFADPVQIEQVLLNLCTNARDAMPDGGVLTLRTDGAAVSKESASTNSGAKEGRYGRVSVKDTGMGIAPETLPRIFEPFFTTKEIGRGTGLGLSSVYGIVRQHGGFIRVTSEPGAGAEFEIYLPVAAEDARIVSEGKQEPVQGGSETLLLAEDEEAVRDLAKDVLESAGYRLLVATDGVEAQEIFAEHGERIDLCVLDAVMPRATGYSAAESILARCPDARILFCSGYGQSGTEFDLSHCVDRLQKPFTPNTLLNKVREMLNRRSSNLPPPAGTS
jgi:two-component system, cell cycle sensor histidine kinase and response regulator CckA